MAPSAKLVIYKVLDNNGSGEDSWIIKALDHIFETNERAGHIVIHGVNLSLGGEFDVESFNCGYTPLCVELRRLWRQGVVVVIAAGNEGFASLSTSDGDAIQANMGMSLGDPGNLEDGDRRRLGAQGAAAHVRHVVLLVARPDGRRPDEARLRRAGRAHPLRAQRRAHRSARTRRSRISTRR